MDTNKISRQQHLFLEDLLPLRSLVITLEFLDSAQFGYFHQPAVTAFLRHLLPECEHYDQLFVIDTPESGCLHYKVGDRYRFQLIALDGSDQHLLALLNRLSRLPATAPLDDASAPLRNNVRLLGVQDSFTARPVFSLDESCLFGPQELTEEALLWQQNAAGIRWRWLSPARLLLDKKQRKEAKGEQRFCRDSDHLPPNLLLSRLYDSIADLIRRRGRNQNVVRHAPPELQSPYSHLFWLDNFYSNGKGQQPMGGVLGEFQLNDVDQLDISWWRLLILGQYLGIGHRRVFGWGRYQLLSDQEAYSYPRVCAAQPLWDAILTQENLHTAYRKVKQNLSTEPKLSAAEQSWVSEGHEHDVEDGPDEYDISEDVLQRLSQKLRNGHYQPPELRGWLLKKRSGGYRALAVPPFWDRVLQRAVSQVLTPRFEAVMYSGSYGYRPGRSRQRARDAIQQAWREGFRWVFESDLKDFFDSVQHNWLEVRLAGLLGDDPLIPLIMQWMAADVEFSGERIQRKAGLPQGSPLSPLLANMVLDDFDTDMANAGFRLIRFADDFVVMCKNPAQARKAEARARESLAEHGLSLNEDKTHIKAMDEGLRYLGYLFVNDMALDVGGSKHPTEDVPSGERVSHPWLSQVMEHPLHALNEETGERELKHIASPAPITPVGQRDDSGMVVCVTGDIAVASSRIGRLRVHREDKLLLEQPWHSLQALVLFGNHHITTPALRSAMAAGVAVHLADKMGNYQGTAWSGAPDASPRLWLRQQSCFADETQCLRMAVALVDARIRHMTEVMRNRELKGYKELRLLRKELPRAKDLQQLNGYEGAASARYFRALATLVPSEFGFDGRNRRPPKDPFNVLLSLGYTLLYGYADSLIRVVGLLPWLGFYHQPHGSHATLASDLMEPFRHRVERKALSMIRKRQIKASDFDTNSQRCVMDKAALRLYLAELTADLESPAMGKADKQPQRMTDHMIEQNRSLLNTINAGEPFEPWRSG